MKLQYCAIDFINNKLYGEFENENPFIGPNPTNIIVEYKNEILINPKGFIRFIDNDKENTTTKYL